MPTAREQKQAATSTAAPQTTAPVQEKPDSQPVKITEKEQSSGDAVVETKDSSTDHPKEINSQPANRLKRHRGGASPIRCNPLSTAARPYAVRGTLTVPSSNPADDVQS